MRKSVMKALRNKGTQDPRLSNPRNSPKSLADYAMKKSRPGKGPTSVDAGQYSERLLRSDNPRTRAGRKQVIEDEFGNLPIR